MRRFDLGPKPIHSSTECSIVYKVYMSKVKEAVLAIFFTLFALSAFAQTGSVRGRIIDAKTKRPLEFVNVSIRATGTQTE